MDTINLHAFIDSENTLKIVDPDDYEKVYSYRKLEHPVHQGSFKVGKESGKIYWIAEADRNQHEESSYTVYLYPMNNRYNINPLKAERIQ